MQSRYAEQGEGIIETFWFEKNLQGDIIAVYNENGMKLVSYQYDAWGNFTTIYHNGGADTVADWNPFKYRGYYYDEETGFYYLNSRYYDPQIRRFINADGYVSTGQGILGYNMYAYCGNNPVMRQDDTGEGWLGAIIGGVAGGIVGAAFGAINAVVNGESIGAGMLSALINGAVCGAIAGCIAQDIATCGISTVGTGTLVLAGVAVFTTGVVTDLGNQACNDGFDNLDVSSALQTGAENVIFSGASLLLPGAGAPIGDFVVSTVYNMVTSSISMMCRTIASSFKREENTETTPQLAVIPIYA